MLLWHEIMTVFLSLICLAQVVGLRGTYLNGVFNWSLALLMGFRLLFFLLARN